VRVDGDGDGFDSGVTRRGFVTGAAAGALALAGCGSDSADGEARWDREADVVVIGSGTGLAGALAAAAEGAEVVVLEKRLVPGGTTAMSGGVAWVPNNHRMREEGIEDSRERALTYLRHLALGQADDELLVAFAEGAPEMAKFLEEQGAVRWRVSKTMGAVSDYHPEWPGAVQRGRSIEPDVEGLRLYGGDLVSGLYETVRSRGIPVLLETPVKRLSTRESEAGMREVIGVEAEHAGAPFRVRARKAVLLASGGFDWDDDLRRHFLRGPSPYPLGSSGNTGDGLRMAMAIGADLRNLNEVWGISAYADEAREAHEQGTGASLNAQIELRAPASLVVNRHGERFMNEAADYDSSWRSYFGWENWGELRYRNVPAYILFDASVRRNATIAGRKADDALPDWVHADDSLAGLAARLGIDPSGLEATVARFNANAREGHDPDFMRGKSLYDRFGSEDVGICLAPLVEPPFFGAELTPALLGTCGGARVNRHAQVLDPFGQVIRGLYASGNAAGIGSPGASYGGGGGTIGPALTFAYLAGRHAAGSG
jgi:succinate dehydrogenase/fumarate reductase flavoprotein subunit